MKRASSHNTMQQLNTTNCPIVCRPRSNSALVDLTCGTLVDHFCTTVLYHCWEHFWSTVGALLEHFWSTLNYMVVCAGLRSEAGLTSI
eukprot:9028124-Heterocapsa_arctica.AAC.1